MKRVLTALVLIPLVLLVLFKAPVWVFALVTMVFAVAGISEFLNIADQYGNRTFKKAILGMTLALFLIETLRQYFANTYSQYPNAAQWKLENTLSFAVLGLLGIAPLVFLGLGMLRASQAEGVHAAAFSSFAIPYVTVPLLALVGIRATQDGIILILYLFVVVWSGDVFAYYIGKNFGRHALAPRVSPKKSWEGTIASVVASVALGATLFHWRFAIQLMWPEFFRTESPGTLSASTTASIPNTIWLAIFLSVIINVAAQIGDLAESLLKRGAGVKDSGTLLPGHGGVLDRIDALLFAAPVLWLYAMIESGFLILPYPTYWFLNPK